MIDLLIENGTVVDGTGAPRYHASVGVRDGVITEIGEVSEPATRVLDADGRVVSPGFIDVHTHYDAQAFWDPTLSPSPLHGVTSVIAGNCGFTIAPLTDPADRYLREMLARVEGMPLSALEVGVPWDWRTTAEYLDRLDQAIAVNAGFMVGHSAIRRCVMGPAAVERTCSDQELIEMVALLEAGLEAGGLGFSSTWSTSHNDANGLPVPSRWADSHELIELASTCGRYVGTSLEFLPKSPPRHGFDEESLAVMIAMSRTANRPLNWNLMRATAENRYDPEIEGRLESGSRALRERARIVALLMPEPLDIRLSFETGVQLDTIAGWREPMCLPISERIALLSDPGRRAELAELAANDENRREYTDWSSYEILETFTPDAERYSGRMIGDIAAEMRCDPFDALVDICLADDLRTAFHQPLPEESSADWEVRAELARDPRVLVGGSDAGAHLDMIGSHRYPTEFVANFVRRHEILSLEEAVRLLTSAPAEYYGLVGRGLLAPGATADIVIFDESEIEATELVTRFDLPGGSGRLYSEGKGIESVIVNGTKIVAQGEFTGSTPGRILRSGTDTSNPPMR